MFIKLLSKGNAEFYLAIEKIIYFNKSINSPNETHINLMGNQEMYVQESPEEIINLINEEKINKEEEKIKSKRSITILNDEE